LKRSCPVFSFRIRLSGVPLYLIDDPQRYLKNTIFEEKLGVTGKFSEVITELKVKRCGVATGGGVLNLSAGSRCCWRRSEQKTGVGTRERHRRLSSRHAAAQHSIGRVMSRRASIT